MLHKVSGSWRLGLFLSLISVIMWGLLPLTLMISLKLMDAYTISWYRFLGSSFLLGLYIFWRWRHHKIFLKKIDYLLLGLAITGLLLNYIAYIIGLNYTTPGSAQLLIQLAPMFLMIGSIIFFKEKFCVKQWIGFIALIIGMILFFNNRYNQIFSHSLSDITFLKGMVLIIIAAFTWAIYALCQKQLLINMSPSIVLFIISSFGVMIFYPFSTPEDILRQPPLYLILLGFAMINTVAAYGAFSLALEHWEASRVSAVLSITPLVTIFLGWIALKIWPLFIVPENINIISMLGATLVVSGSLLASLSRKQ